LENRVGKLLIAHPNLPSDEWFYRTVVYIYADSQDKGTLGVCLNVPTNLSVEALCQQRHIAFPYSHPLVYKGGPVSDTSVIMLHTNEWRGMNTTPAGKSYSLTSDDMMFERLSLGDQPAYWKMFLGLCGWKPGQLDMEIAGQFPYGKERSWLTADANDHILFELDGDKMWEAAIELSSKQMFSIYF